MKAFLPLTFILLVSSVSFAQMPPGLRNSFNQMQFRMIMQMMNTRYWYRNADYLENNKYKFTVTLKDGSTREVSSKIYTDTILHSSYLLFVNKKIPRGNSAREERIYPTKTLKISRVYQDFNHPEKTEVLEGRATDSCWLFKAITGKITAYSFLSERFNLNTYYLSAFQFENGEIQRLDPAKLKAIIADNNKAMKAFNKKDYYTAIIRYNKSASK